MSLNGSATRYGAVAIWLHWLTAALVVAAYVVSPGGQEARIYAPASDFNRSLHETLGLLVFFLVVVRLLWRFADRQPESPPMPRWMELAGKVTHYLLYLLLIALPLTAILGAWYQGHPLTPFVIGNIALPMGPARDIGNALANIHGTLGNVILWLAGLHAAAGLYHHYIRRDGVLAAMLPWLKEPRRTAAGVGGIDASRSGVARQSGSKGSA